MKSRLEQLLDELLRQIDIPAMEQAVSEQYKSQIRRRWELPEDYWMLLERCCGHPSWPFTRVSSPHSSRAS